MKKRSFLKRLNNRFDTLMSKGTWLLIIMMVLVVMAIVILDAVLARFFSGGGIPGGFGRFLWDSFTRVLDPGTMSSDNETGSIGYILFMCISTFAGIVLMSLLVGVITTNLGMRMDTLQNGNPPVWEKGHTLILGYDEHVFSVIKELTEANKNQKHGCIVVLMDLDRKKMEGDIHARIPDTLKTRIICRSGRIDDMSSLDNAGIGSCKSVIILPQNDDAVTIKSILACSKQIDEYRKRNANTPNQYRRQKTSGDSDAQAGVHIAASINNENNLAAAHAAGGEHLKAIYVKKTIARVIAQTAYQPGLTVIFNELFSFYGQEMYFEDTGGCVGLTIAHSAGRIGNACLAGILRQGMPFINPPHNMIVEPGDRLILLEADDGAFRLTGEEEPDESAWMPVHRAGTRAVRHILVIGCNPMLPDVLDELSKYVGEGSVIHIAAPHIYKCRPIESPVNIETVECDIRDRNVLSGLLGRNPDVIIVLSDHACNPGTADANTLIVLLHLDDLLKGCAIRPTVVSEMQDAVNQSLAACTHVNDLVVGSNMIAQLLTQISESSDMAKVFEALLSDEGSEIHIKPVCRYVKTGMNVTMRTVAASALRYGELFLGYKIAGEVPLIKLNPDKSQTLTFSAGDGIIVLAENDG